MRKNNATLVTVVFCVSMLMIFVIAGRQINSQVVNRTKSVKKTQSSADLSEIGILTAENSDIRQSGKGKQTAVSVAPSVGADLGEEVEPNNTFMEANVLGGRDVKIRGDIIPNGDLDWFSFTANAGDRVYAAVMTNYSANASTDSQLRIFAADGTTLIEFDDDDGSLGSSFFEHCGCCSSRRRNILRSGQSFFGNKHAPPIRVISQCGKRRADSGSRTERYAGNGESASGKRLGERREKSGGGDRTGLVFDDAQCGRYGLSQS